MNKQEDEHQPTQPQAEHHKRSSANTRTPKSDESGVQADEPQPPAGELDELLLRLFDPNDPMSASEVKRRLIAWRDTHTAREVEAAKRDAHMLGWHEGRAAASNPELDYGYSGDAQLAKDEEVK